MVSLPLDGLPDRKRKLNRRSITGIVVSVTIVLLLLFTNVVEYLKISFTSVDESACPIPDIKYPASPNYDAATVENVLYGKKFRAESAERLSGAVQVDTQIGDNPKDVKDDPEFWKKFNKFHRYLHKTFPEVYAATEVVKINTYGLVFYWKGSDSSLKPLLLTAHQDVVPVQKSTLGDWSHPPFLGYYDGESLYGRGSADCKNVLIAIMESLSLLVKQSYKPERGIVVGFGIDEESSGKLGAANIAKYLEERFGKDSFYALIDEGTPISIDPLSNRIMAIPATAEKGHANIVLSLTTPGGHSSVPPPHTSIGLMSELITLIESHPYLPHLTTENPFMSHLQCSAVHNNHTMPSFFKKAIMRAGFDKFANSLVVKKLSEHPLAKALMQTTQAVDVINGGEKSNALPENVVVEINHRIAVDKSAEILAAEVTERVAGYCEEKELALVAFGKVVVNKTAKGNLVVDFENSLDPSPVSPSSGNVWDYLAGSVRYTFENFVFKDSAAPLVVAPTLMPASTDTRHYWNLTKSIFRFSPMFSETDFLGFGVHSVDEHIEFDMHLQLLSFFYNFIQTVDTAKAGN